MEEKSEKMPWIVWRSCNASCRDEEIWYTLLEICGNGSQTHLQAINTWDREHLDSSYSRPHPGSIRS